MNKFESSFSFCYNPDKLECVKNNIMARIDVNPLAGFRDFLPSEMILRNEIIEKIKNVFECYGFEPLETPAIEKLEILQGKYGEEEKLIYKFEDLGGRKIALRYDLTVPLARVIARFPELPKPFKRYQISRVWRYDRPQKGRYREFWQCDVDIVGTKEIIADAECLKVAYVALKEIGLNNFVFRINNRKLMDALLEKIGIKDEKLKIEALRAIDKLDKIGIEGVKKELKKRGLEKFANKIVEIIEKLKSLREIEKFVGKNKGIEEIEELFKYAKMFEIPEDCLKFDLSLVRGLDYYTGNVFEIWSGEFDKSIGGGGRYDDLIGIFYGEKIPAVGISLGLERIIEILRNKIKMGKSVVNVYVGVTNFSDKLIKEAIKIAEKLRSKKIKTRVCLKSINLYKQLEIANKLGIKYFILVGEKELKEGCVRIKNLEKRIEEKIKIDEIEKIIEK